MQRETRMAHVLLVEDDAAMLGTLTLGLRSQGYMVSGAETSEEGLQLFSEHEFDVVVTDIILPETDGLGFIAELRRLSPDVKVIAISGGGRAVEYDFLEAARNHGAAATLAKPFHMTEFYRLVDQCSGH
jgi:DNA-binding response OmpR family regulator